MVSVETSGFQDASFADRLTPGTGFLLPVGSPAATCGKELRLMGDGPARAAAREPGGSGFPSRRPVSAAFGTAWIGRKIDRERASEGGLLLAADPTGFPRPCKEGTPGYGILRGCGGLTEPRGGTTVAAQMKGIAAALILLAAMPGAGMAVGGEPRRVGDLLGRDLDLPGYGAYGHVGLWTGHRVLECLGEVPPIQKRSLASFQSVTVYWGARYLPLRRNFRKVIRKGWEQRNFRPKFTLAPEFRVGRFVRKKVWDAATGRWETRTVMVRAKFRCDTLVSYAYQAGIGYRVRKSGTFPGPMFQAFGEER